MSRVRVPSPALIRTDPGTRPGSRATPVRGRREKRNNHPWKGGDFMASTATFNEKIEVTTLPNGIRVVSETVTHVQSTSIGLWVGVGSRDEEKEVRGVTHFIEHMLFKGTKRRDAR